MKMNLDDIIGIESEMLNALRDYMGVLKLNNCNTCVRGLDICPNQGEPLRINCAYYHNVKDGERPTQANNNEADILGAAMGAMFSGFANNVKDGENNVIDSDVCEPADKEEPEETNMPDDPKLQKYLKH